MTIKEYIEYLQQFPGSMAVVYRDTEDCLSRLTREKLPTLNQIQQQDVVEWGCLVYSGPAIVINDL